ncbi:hypothetical protein [Streptomyces sp. NPDC014894]|uniref:hypothetical protein n=1 Tax=unclassified Streptomyces TaxID=2593676 RepID=UPI0036F6F96B
MSALTCGSLAVVIAATGTAPAHATYYSGGMPKAKFSVEPVGVNKEWVKFLDTGRSNWNKSKSGASIGRKKKIKQDFTADRYNASWLGMYAPGGSRKKRTFDIYINAKSLYDITGGGAKYDRWVRSTITHELGHALSLKDNPGTKKSSLMKHSRDRSKVQKPTAYDVSEVKRIY